MMLFRSAICSLLFLLPAACPAWAACSTYSAPTKMNPGEFLAGDFGTLAMYQPGVANRMLVFEQSSCYDIAYLGLERLKFELNNRDATEGPSYLAANVIRGFDYPMAGETPFHIRFRRNGNSSDSTAKWVRVKIANVTQGARIAGSHAHLLDDEFEPEEKLGFDELDKFVDGSTAIGGSSTIVDSWHAHIVTVADGGAKFLPPRDGHDVLLNTRSGIEHVGLRGIDLAAASNVTVTSQVQLIKFARLATSDKPVEALDIRVTGASCLYLRYRIDGSQDPLLQPGNIKGDFLVLRLKADAAC